MNKTTLEDKKMTPAPVALEIQIEELEAKQAPEVYDGVRMNHNETLVHDSEN